MVPKYEDYGGLRIRIHYIPYESQHFLKVLVPNPDPKAQIAEFVQNCEIVFDLV
jgi:hypothetical protein